MTIRPATEADCAGIAQMLARLAAETGDGAAFASTPDTILVHGFGPAAFFDVLISETGSTSTGMALYFRHFSTKRGLPGVFVQDLWIAQGARKSGLGAALLSEVARSAGESWGARYMALSVHGANTNAQGFYERLGFAGQSDDIALFLDGDAFGSLLLRESAA